MKNMLKKLFCIVLSVALFVTSFSVMAFAEDEADADAYAILIENCTQIGEDDENPVYYTQVPYGTTSVVFSDLSLETEMAMIAAIGGNTYVEGTDTAEISGYALDLEYLAEKFEIYEDYSDTVESGAYGFWIMDDDYEISYFVINIQPYEGNDPNYFEPSAGEITGCEKDGFTMSNYEQDESGAWVPVEKVMDLYTVGIPFGTEDVTLSFAEDRIAYGYSAAGEYMYSCSANTESGYGNNGQDGEKKANVYNTDAIVVVQTPYDSNSKTEMLYAVKFVYTYTFEAYAGGVQLTDIEFVEDVYTLTDTLTGAEIGTMGAYVVSVPEGTENVTLKFSDNVLAYNYTQDGQYITGLYDDFYTGSRERSIQIDADGEEGYDFIQVQVPYDEYWNTSILYAITFEDSEDVTEVVKPETIETETEVAKLKADTEETLGKLMEGLSGNCNGASDWNVVSAAAMELEVELDEDKVIEDAIAAYNAPSGTNLAAAILKLVAIGEDPTALSDGEDGTLDLVGKLASSSSCMAGWAECQAYALLAYAATEYGVSEDAENSVSSLIEGIAAYQNEDGGFGGWGSSADTTGAVLAALSLYADVDESVTEMLISGIGFLVDSQNDDGGWGYAAGADTNVDSTALVIIGLSALGIDCTGEELTVNGNNALTAILAFANEDATGLELPAGTSVAYAESDALRALCAYSGMRNNGTAYNIYTMAQYGSAQYIPAEVAPEAEAELANQPAADGNWYVYRDGEIATDVTTVAHNDNGWWYVENGKVDFTANTVAHNENGWWVIENGKVNFNATGVYHNDNGWWYCKDGKVDFTYNGFGSNSNGDWYCENGKVNFDVDDIIYGEVKGVKAWWYVVKSKVTYGEETIAHNSNGWWYVGKDGKVDFTANTVAHNMNGWWMVENGKVTFTYNGLGTNANGTWYIKDSKVDFTFNGTYGGKTIVNGKAQ